MSFQTQLRFGNSQTREKDPWNSFHSFSLDFLYFINNKWNEMNSQNRKRIIQYREFTGHSMNYNFIYENENEKN